MHYSGRMMSDFRSFPGIVIGLFCINTCLSQSTTKQFTSYCGKDTCVEQSSHTEHYIKNIRSAVKIQAEEVDSLKKEVNGVNELLKIQNQTLQEISKIVTYLSSQVYPGAVRDTELGYDYLLVTEKKSWEDARQDCYQKGFHLASILSELEQMSVFSLITADQFRTSSQYVWVSGTDEGHEKCFIWVGSQLKRFNETYDRWFPGQPNNDAGEHCVALGQVNYWYDRLCSAQHFYVCKKSIGEVITSIPSADDLHASPLC